MITKDLYPVFDTFISSKKRDKNFSDSSYLFVGGQGSNIYRTIMRFDFSDIPIGASIKSAILKIYLHRNFYPCGTKIFAIHKIVTPYNDNEVNWGNMPYYFPVAANMFAVGSQANITLDIDLTTLVIGWQLGLYKNCGMLIKAEREYKNDLINLIGVDFGDVAFRPFIQVEYETAEITDVITEIGAPDCSIGETGDFYIDTSNGQTYLKQIRPDAVPARPIPAPTGATLQVGSTRTYTTIQAALAAAGNGDRLLLDAETFNITNTINVNKSVTIEGQGTASTTVITASLAPSPFYMFNVTASDVVFSHMKIVQDYPRSAGETDTAIAFHIPAATVIYVDNCDIGVSESGIWLSVKEFQITNCNFTYAPNALSNNRYSCIIISSTSGNSIISNNTFVPGSQDVGCFFVRITNLVSPGLLGKLVLSDNSQLASAFTLRHLLAIEEFMGADFELYINNNITISEGNVPVLLNVADLDIFKFIEVVGNSVQNTAGKGLIGIDVSFGGSTEVFSSNNTIAEQSFEAGWASATVPQSFIVGYRTTIVPPPVLPLANCYWLSLI